jgi:aspartate ammonia-lyase
VLDGKIADAIIRACDRVIAGEMLDQFITDFIQGGAGTSTNMNANEVIANLALEILGHKKGEYQYVNPNDHVNFGQSTNDVYPTAFHLGLISARELHGSAAPACELSSPRLVSSTRCSRWAALTCRTPCRCRWGRFHGWGTTIGEEVEHIADVRRCCNASTWAPPQSVQR